MFFPNFGGSIDNAPLSQITNIALITRMQTKKIKKYAILTILPAICLLINVAAGAQSASLALHKPARGLVWPEKLEREISFLADSLCGGRASGTPGNVETASWIARKFATAGLMPFGPSWFRSILAENGTTGRNILGFLPGSSKNHPDRYVIVGAHHDHLGTIDGRLYPGADANASGIVSMTSLAEMLAMTRSIGKSFTCNVIFAAFDGKEMDMAGSRALWEMIKAGQLVDPVSGKTITKDKIVLMVNIDQIGSTLSPLNDERKDYLIMLDGTSRRTSYKDVLTSCNSMYDINLDLGFTYYGSENFTKLFYRLSDQKVFADNRIPAVMFTSGITMNNNKPWDDTASLDINILHKRIYLMYHWLIMTL